MTPAPLSEAELDRLDALLHGGLADFEPMPLDAVQGLFFALACGPAEIPSSRWLPLVLGASPPTDATGTLREAIDLVTRFHDQCRSDVDGERFGLILYDGEDGGHDLQTWCAGYLEGVDLADPDWYEAGDPDEVDELLFPFVVLAGELHERERSQFKDAEWDELVGSCGSALAEAIVEVREYWQIVRNPPQTVRRDSPKIGRNDPCPCGSGRKFKHCCAAAPDATP